ncbi:hypothetical protein [Asticcacaulis sp. AC460]|uniref:hypothetical protein n=1 Tax=Asticcacaulis sp. AC460 TaxID=1282360 RepID=UPI0012DE328F|nr:hypothetical protein [Asticcacaulis sp. AC460]
MKKIWPLLCAAMIAFPMAGEASAAMFQDRGGHERGKDRDGPRGGNDRGGGDRSQENRRDDRINRAIRIAESRGRVLDAGQQSGSIFWVRVATDRGRVDLLIDTDSGRIIGER